MVELVERGDFEGVLSWIVGLQATACWHAFTLAGPPRLVMDVPSPQLILRSKPALVDPPGSEL